MYTTSCLISETTCWIITANKSEIVFYPQLSVLIESLISPIISYDTRPSRDWKSKTRTSPPFENYAREGEKKKKKKRWKKEEERTISRSGESWHRISFFHSLLYIYYIGVRESTLCVHLRERLCTVTLGGFTSFHFFTDVTPRLRGRRFSGRSKKARLLLCNTLFSGYCF